MNTKECKENIEQIAKSIEWHTKQELSQRLPNRAFARACCTVDSTAKGISDQIMWLVNFPNTRGLTIHRGFTGSAYTSTGPRTTLESDGQPVFKNTRLGEILIKAYEGTHHYSTKMFPKKTNDIKITIHNRSVYTPCPGGVEDIEVRIAGESGFYRFQKLSELLKVRSQDHEDLQKLLKQKEEKEREKAAAQKAAKELAEREEQKRLEALRRKMEEEERLREEEIKRLEQSIKETNQKIKSVKTFLRKSAFLRSQHMLDPYQEDAKRSHIYDGIPIVIDGGPGTGKTTTVIQRLKFLLDYEALDKNEDGYDSPLTSEQIHFLTDPEYVHSRWLFFSPTDLLLQFLQNNMNAEGLGATDENTRTLPKFRQKIMRDYELFDPSKDGSFKNYRPAIGEQQLILAPMDAIAIFERFCVDYLTKRIVQRISLQTSQYSWHQAALRIKSICSHFKNISSVDSLIQLYNSLMDSEKENVQEIENNLKKILNTEGVKLQQAIIKNEEIALATHSLFDDWRKEKFQLNEEDGDLSEEEEEELESFSKQEFETQLFSQIKQLLKQIALQRIDGKIKLSKRNQALLVIIETLITDDIKLDEIGENAWFVRNFVSLCRGIENNLLQNIPAIYKSFRKNILSEKEKRNEKVQDDIELSKVFNLKILDKVVKKDANKHLHPDEQNLLVGFINNLLFEINKKSKVRFNSLKHKYVRAYINNVKPVIGIDEATDYSLLDYYFMVSFRHYDFSSITLCGDIMQGLNSNGIHDWSELQKTFLPKLEIKTLNISYRQLPTLLDLAREMYKDDRNEYPPYQSEIEKTVDEPKPLLFISDDDDEKAEWISNRILDIYNAYDKELPSIAIFVGENVNIREFIERINDLDIINGIEVVDCSGNNALQSKEQVRVFRLSEVKGMEFEAVFFYDIDQAIQDHSLDLMRRFLYVGVSRATSHLAATMCSNVGHEQIVKYFVTETEGW